MGTIRAEDIQKVREASDLLAIVGERSPVKKRGRDFWCCCPLHNEKTPSFKIDPSTQLWHCFGCGEGGDVFGFIMKTEDMSFPEAVRYLAERAHIDIVEEGGRPNTVGSGRKARLKQACQETAEFYHLQLMRNPASDAAAARSYLAGRGFGGSVPKTWQLGFAPGRGELVRHLRAKGFSNEEMLQANVAYDRDGRVVDRFFNRVMFPIRDVQGDCIAFGGRVIGSGEPKYLNSQETPLFHKSQVLYGLDRAKAAMASSGTAVVVEGYTDVIALHEAGLPNVVATLGTALTTQHIRQLSRHAQRRIVYLFDGDEAGQRAADRALGLYDAGATPVQGRSRVELVACTLPDGLDPAEFVEARGADELRELLSHAKPLVQYGIDRRLQRADLSSAEGRAAAFADALSVLAPFKDTTLAKDYAKQIAGRTGVGENEALEALRALRPPRDAGQVEKAAPPAAQPPVASSGEQSRRRFERELLCLCAQHPQLALEHADALARIQWHDAVCADAARSMLQTLSEDPSASSARIVAEATRAAPAAAGVLTGRPSEEAGGPQAYAQKLADELEHGDKVSAFQALRIQLNNSPNMPDDEAQELYRALAELQAEINQRNL